MQKYCTKKLISLGNNPIGLLIKTKYFKHY